MLLVRSIGRGGAERQLVLLAERLRERHDVHVVMFYDQDVSFVGPEGPVFPVEPLGKRGRWDVVGFARRFRRVVRRVQPDVIYAFLNSASLLALLAGLERPRPRVVWGIRSSNMDLTRYGLLPRLLRRVECLLSAYADLAISNSRAGRTEALREGYRTDVLVVPNGIDTARFAFDPECRERMRARWGVPESSPVIGMVARHDPMKGYEVFLDAAALYLSAEPEARFVLVGGGEPSYTRELHLRARRLGLEDRVIWAGPVDDVACYYSGMDLFTSASIYGEGFSNVIGEAMACSLLPVVTDVGDAPWIVGELGAVVRPGSPDELATAWARVRCNVDPLSGGRDDRARKRIEANFSVEQMVRTTESVLLDVVARS